MSEVQIIVEAPLVGPFWIYLLPVVNEPRLHKRIEIGAEVNLKSGNCGDVHKVSIPAPALPCILVERFERGLTGVLLVRATQLAIGGKYWGRCGTAGLDHGKP